MDGLTGLVLAGIALAGSPGPANLSLAATAAAFGARRSFRYCGGIVAGVIAVMALVGTGAAALFLGLPGAMPAATALAAGYVAWLAFRIATAPPPVSAVAQGPPPAFAAGFGLSLLNPKGYATMAALLSGFTVVPGRPALDAAAKAFVLTMVVAGSATLWLIGGAALTRLCRDARLNRILNLIFAALLLVAVAVALGAGQT